MRIDETVGHSAMMTQAGRVSFRVLFSPGRGRCGVVWCYLPRQPHGLSYELLHTSTNDLLYIMNQ